MVIVNLALYICLLYTVALDTGCAVWSTDGVDDVVWNAATDTQAATTTELEVDGECLWKEVSLISVFFLLHHCRGTGCSA